MKLKYYALFLSSQGILKKYLGGETPGVEEIKRIVFVEARADNTRIPDYFYKNNQDLSLKSVNSIADLLLKSIAELTQEYLEFDGLKVHVINGKFSKWQELLTHISPLVLVVGAIFHNHTVLDKDKLEAIKINLNKTALPSLNIPLLDKMIEQQGLNELHLHLNGSTETDFNWLKVLQYPRVFRRIIIFAQKNTFVREQYLQMDDDIDERRLCEMLKIARILRDKLVRVISKKETQTSKKINLFNEIKSSRMQYGPLLGSSKEHPANNLDIYYKEAGLLEQEAIFLLQAFRMLNTHGDLFAHYLYFYILIQQYFNRFIVHQENQWGFDQFQKITLNNHRGLIEWRDYFSRFKQLEGMHKFESVAKLEGRFAPKHNPTENYKLLRRIIGDFEKYATEGKFAHYIPGILSKGELKKRMVLTLVAHMTKLPEDASKRTHLNICRFRDLRRSYKNQAKSLTFVHKKISKVREYLTGIDAAANEMHTPPEVFAPSFRYLRRRGFNQITYHVGEDFVHLVSGIRAVDEAISFLNMKPGNRIGHATALGISPELWKERIGEKIVINQGEWLDNLVWAAKMLAGLPSRTSALFEIDQELNKYYCKIYGNKIPYNIHTCITAWELRKLDPLIVLDSTNRKLDCLDMRDHIEWEMIDDEKAKFPEAFELFKLYHRPEIHKLYEDLIEVETEQCFFSNDILTDLQEMVLKEASNRKLAIESMPTSNVRISFYQNHKEHHIYRWLNNDKQLVVLGSDDPGIFATNLRNEYAHVYESLVQNDIPDIEAFQLLKEIHEHSGAYIFKPR